VSEDVAAAMRRLSDGAFGLIRRMVRDREEALDLTQDVLVRVLSRRRPDSPADLKAYAMRAAYRAALNALRDRKRHARIHDRLAAEQRSRPDNPDAIETAERKRMIAEALGELPPKQREAISYRFFGELAVAEIAAAMGISEGAVKVHLFRGLANLNAQLADKMKEMSI